MLQYQDQEWEIQERIERNKKGGNLPIPDWYKEKTGVPDDLRWFWSAFWELDTERQVVDGIPCRIPWSRCLQYAQYHQIDFDYLWHLIVTLDNAYISFKVKAREKQLEELKTKTKNNKPKGQRRGR